MAGGLTIAQRQLVLDYFAGRSGLTQNSTFWVSLHTGDPGNTGASEVTGTGYARVQINANGGSAPAWANATAADPSVIANSAAVTFAASGGAFSSSASITWFGIWTAITAGTFLARGQLTAGVVVGSAGIVLSFATSQLTLTASFT